MKIHNITKEQYTMEWKSKFADGVYLDVSNEEYHADVAISSSGIKRLIKSPLDFWYNSPLNPEKTENKTTVAMKIGTAYHMLILEPEKFNYEIISGTKTTTKEGFLTEAEYNQLQNMKNVLDAKPFHSQLFKGGYPEVSVFWTDKETGLPCKCRFDYWKPYFVTDLKTTNSIADSSLRFSIVDFGYEISASMYMAGTTALRELIKNGNCAGLESFDQKFIDDFLKSETRFVFLMQEKEAPYDSRGKAVAECVASCGNDKFRRGLEIAKEQFQKYGFNQWSSPYNDIEDLYIEQLSQSINYF